ncbi:MAG: LysR family transcriptional regulator [Lachnospiraceae bacterium]|nr:LysR family transcriptional regulator [Lachnospiraceae bacterium]
MTIRHLRIFITVAETGKMSLAAKKLYLTQPTISQAIRELEEHYDTKLFDRLSKRLYITEEGHHLLALARNTVRSFDDLELRMQSETKVEHFRLGTTVTVGACLLPSLTEDFRARRPQVDLFSFIANTQVIEEKLLKSELDVGVVEGVIKSPDLISLPMVDDFLVLACSVDHPFASLDSFTPSDLEGQDFVMREQGSGTRALFEDYLRANHIQIRCRVEAPFPEAMKNAILYNHCMAVISVRLIEEELQKGTIHIIRNPNHAWNRTFNLVYHKDKLFSESMVVLKELLYEYRKPEIC